ncbi:MAG: hypothetical protein CMF74_11985 [Maricaulis sp.]|jgi:ABC-type uncharacterized transport system involved in gliding motility auxiliary subunit|nr:hypothetical protein [Maricaulis sp.]
MSRKWHLAAMLAALGVLVAAVNLIAANFLSHVRVDATEAGLYRLSDGSLETIEEMAEPVRWTFYYSRRAAADYPAVRAYGARVRELLESYESAADGRIELTEIDPEPFSEDEDAAIAAGLTPAPIGEGQRLFFGLVAEDSVDRRLAIAYFAPEREALLEYELTAMLGNLTRTETPVLAILTGLPLAPDAPARLPSRIVSQLDANYQIEWIERGFLELPRADALLIVHPPQLTDAQLYAIDQFAMAGGRLVVALDPMAHIALAPGADGLPPVNARRASDLAPLTQAWGVGYDPEMAAMDRTLALPVQVNEGGRSRVRSYPLWFAPGREQFSDRDLTMAGFSRGINLGSPGVLRLEAREGLTAEALVTTSDAGATLEAGIAATNPSPDRLAELYPDTGSRQVIAARVTGPLPSAFPNGPPTNAGPRFLAESHIARAAQDTDVVVVADVDWMGDSFFLTRDAQFGESVVADNMSFALNLIDMALGNRSLVGLRASPSSARPMTRVDDLRARAEARYTAEQAALQTGIEQARARLAELENPSVTAETADLNPEERLDEVNRLRDNIASAEQRLREVERDFRHDIDALDSALRFWTLWFPPLAILILGIGLTGWRRWRPRP